MSPQTKATLPHEQQPLLPDGENARLTSILERTAHGHQEPQLQSRESTSQVDAVKPPLSRSENIGTKTAAVMVCFCTVGMSVGALGALIPLIEAHYRVRDGTAALIFVCNVTGYLVAAYNLDQIHMRFGRRGVSVIAGTFHILGAAALSTRPPFFAVLLGYWVWGFGVGCVDVGWCAWAVGVSKANLVQGLIHGSFSVGCILGPLVVAGLHSVERSWQAFYYVIGVGSCLEVISLVWAFRFDDGPAYRSTELTGSGSESEAQQGLSKGEKAVWICSLFFLVYIGLEASLSGWLVTYLIRIRHIGPETAALATSLFWAGMAFGRFTLGTLAQSVGLSTGLRPLVILTICFSMSLQILFRLPVPLSISFLLSTVLGFSLGPLFPAALLMLTKNLPESAHVKAVAFAVSVGQVGGAAAPFILGLIAQASGIGRMFDMALGLSVLLLGTWMWLSRTSIGIGAQAGGGTDR